MQVYEIPFYRFTYPLVSVFLCLNLFLWSCFDSVDSFRKEKNTREIQRRFCTPSIQQNSKTERTAVIRLKQTRGTKIL